MPFDEPTPPDGGRGQRNDPGTQQLGGGGGIGVVHHTDEQADARDPLTLASGRQVGQRDRQKLATGAHPEGVGPLTAGDQLDRFEGLDDARDVGVEIEVAVAPIRVDP